MNQLPQRRDEELGAKKREAEKQRVRRDRLYNANRSGGQGEPEELVTFGLVEAYDKTYDKTTPKNERRLERFKNRNFFKVTTTDDHVIPRLANEDKAIVFATDSILSTLMCAPRSVYSWDIVIQRVGNKLFFIKRDGLQLDFLSVNETSQEPLPEAKDDINSAHSWSVEAAYINQNFSQLVLVRDGGRCEVQSYIDVNAKKSFLTSNALNEFDPKYSGVDWRRKLDTQRGAVLETDLKNNANKIAKWTAQAILDNADMMKLGYVTRVQPSDSESRPPILNKENYVSWSSRLIRYAKSRPNGKLIHNSIINGPYVRRMILEPGDTNREIPVNETFHVQTDDELTEKELKQIEANDQAIQTILLDLPEDIYAAVDSCETAQEIWLRVQQMMKGSDIGIQDKKANNLKFLNNLQPEWSRHVTIVHQTKDLHTADYTQLYDFLKYNQKEVDELKAKRLAKTQDSLALMANSNNPYAFPAPHQDQPSSNHNYMKQPVPNPKDITDATTIMNMALALMDKAFKLNYSTPTNNNQRISSNPRNRQIEQPSKNMGQDRQMQLVGGNANQNGNGNLVAIRAEGNAAGHNGIQLQAEEFDLMAVAADLDEIEEFNANCILMANLQETVEQHLANVEETRALYDSLYQNLATEVEKVNTVNRKLK
nr:eukaryotic translation initiation factor 3 subunit D-like [Tanacetum cinerariifolium]